jgi:hypothetical protein
MKALPTLRPAIKLLLFAKIAADKEDEEATADKPSDDKVAIEQPSTDSPNKVVGLEHQQHHMDLQRSPCRVNQPLL